MQGTCHPDWTVSFKTLAVFWKKRLASCWTKMLQRIRTVVQVTGRRCYNVSGTSYKLLDEDVTTYQERLASYWTKMLQRIRKLWLTTQATGRYYTPPKPQPPQNPPKPTQKKTENTPQKRQYTKVTTVLPLEEPRHQKHAMRSKEQTVNEPISFSWWSLRVENLSCKPLLLT